MRRADLSRGRAITIGASLWQVNPAANSLALTRIAMVDIEGFIPWGRRSTTSSLTQEDWESSGVVDVTRFFPDARGTVLMLTVQAHDLRTHDDLEELGQLLLFERVPPPS